MRTMLIPLALGLCAAVPAAASASASASAAQDDAAPAPSPNQIVEQAPAGAWLAIAPEDLLVMDLAPGAEGAERRVIIQLIPPPFSQGWVENIRALARAHWWDGTSINRVQDNYVVQWGDPAEEEAERKPLPDGLNAVPESEYAPSGIAVTALPHADSYAQSAGFVDGWPLASDGKSAWPVHCYAMVGVGRGMSPDTGSGAELYTVIGHAPRHLDRNIALVGRVIEGIEHLSSLPRGKGVLGFYEDATKRVPIAAIRLVSELPEADRPSFEYLSTESAAFARYAEARANRRDPFFILPAGGADICNIPVPVRRKGLD